MLMHTLNIMYMGTSLTNVHTALHANNRATCCKKYILITSTGVTKVHTML